MEMERFDRWPLACFSFWQLKEASSNDTASLDLSTARSFT